MKLSYKNLVVGIGTMLIAATAAEATPAFAKQTDMSCMACHYQNIPKLNSFGREFKLSAYTMVGTKEIKAEQTGGLALPSTLNFGFVTKARVLKEGDTDLKTEIFDEAAFIFGGKIADGVGTSMEFGEGLIGGKIAFTKETSAGRVGLTYFMTDALGAFSGTEVYSTGLYRPVRQFENRKKANIFQKLGMGAGAATGIQAYYSGYGLVATVGQYAPAMANSAVTDFTFKTLARASYNMNIAGFDMALGGYYLGGDVTELVAMNAGNDKVHEVDVDALDRESTGLDLQIEGDVAGMPLMLTAGYVLTNTYSNDTADMTGFSAGVQVNPLDVLGLKAGMLMTSDNTSGEGGETSMIVGTDYMYAQNVRLCLEVSNTSFEDGTDSEVDILFMSMIAF